MIHLDQINEAVKASLRSDHVDFEEVLNYSCLPAGKLFRPLLALSVYCDQTQESPTFDIYKLCSALEVHHAYTLVHDDLPAMDNDDFRRGKPSVHKHYNEWIAILSGDALSLKSIEILASNPFPLAPQAIKMFTKLLGANGLILGQYYDLSGVMRESFHMIVRTHILKTARLLQASLLLGYYLSLESTRDASFKDFSNLYRLGHHLGLSFQLLDDFQELGDDLSSHEKEISPWIHFPKESFQALSDSLLKTNSYLEKLEENAQLQKVIKTYHHKVQKHLSDHADKIKENLKQFKGSDEWLEPISRLLD